MPTTQGRRPLYVAVALGLAVLGGTMMLPVRASLVGLDGRLGGALGVLAVSDFWSAQTGPALLARPAATRWLRGRVLSDDWRRERDLLLLHFLALERQGEPRSALLVSPAARAEVLGAVLAEGEPPAWWRATGSLREALPASPRGSFQLGLLSREEAALALRSVLDDPAGLGLGDARAVLQAVALHPGLLTAQETDRTLAAWVATQRPFAWSLDEMLRARAGLSDLAGAAAKHGVVPVRVDATRLPVAAQAPATRALLGVLRTAGLAPSEGEGLRLTLAVEPREFPGVAWSRATVVRHREKVRLFLGPSASQQTQLLDREVEAAGKEALRGRLRVPSLVVTAVLGDETRTFEVPPFGFLAPDGTAGGPLLDGTDATERARLGLPDELDLLLAAWRFGVD